MSVAILVLLLTYLIISSAMLRKINCTLKRTEASSLGGSAASEPFSLRRGFYLLIYASVVTVVSCFGFMTTCILISTKSTDFVTGEANGTEFAPIIFLTALYLVAITFFPLNPVIVRRGWFERLPAAGATLMKSCVARVGRGGLVGGSWEECAQFELKFLTGAEGEREHVEMIAQ